MLKTLNESSKKYYPFLAMVATWFMGVVSFRNSPHINALYYSQNIILTLLYKKDMSKDIIEPKFRSCLIVKVFTLYWKLVQRLFGNQCFLLLFECKNILNPLGIYSLQIEESNFNIYSNWTLSLKAKLKATAKIFLQRTLRTS